MMTDLLAVMDAVRDDRRIRGITLRGKNGIFCSGGDLKSFNAMQAPGVTQTEVAAMNRRIGDVMLAMNCLLYTSPSPRDLSTSRMPSSA